MRLCYKSQEEKNPNDVLRHKDEAKKRLDEECICVNFLFNIVFLFPSFLPKQVVAQIDSNTVVCLLSLY